MFNLIKKLTLKLPRWETQIPKFEPNCLFLVGAVGFTWLNLFIIYLLIQMFITNNKVQGIAV